MLITIDQCCACCYPDATVWDLLVLLFAREYQATILEGLQDNLMDLCTHLIMTLPETIKRKIPLYSPPRISLPPEIKMKPYPSIETIKEWMHEYDFYSQDMVEEIDRLDKRVNDLRKKSGRMGNQSSSSSKLQSNRKGNLNKEEIRNLVHFQIETKEKKSHFRCTYVTKKQTLPVDTIKSMAATLGLALESHNHAKGHADRGRVAGNFVREDCLCDHQRAFLEFMNTKFMNTRIPTEINNPSVPSTGWEQFMNMEFPPFVLDSDEDQHRQTFRKSLEAKGKGNVFKNQLRSRPKLVKSKLDNSECSRASSSGMTKEEKESIEVTLR